LNISLSLAPQEQCGMQLQVRVLSGSLRTPQLWGVFFIYAPVCCGIRILKLSSHFFLVQPGATGIEFSPLFRASIMVLW